MVRRRKSCRSVPIAPGGQPETQLRFRNRPSSVLQASMRLGEVVGQQFPKTGREEAFGPVLVDTRRFADSELFSAEEMPHEQQEQICYPPVYIRKGTCTRIIFPAQYLSVYDSVWVGNGGLPAGRWLTSSFAGWQTVGGLDRRTQRVISNRQHQESLPLLQGLCNSYRWRSRLIYAEWKMKCRGYSQLQPIMEQPELSACTCESTRATGT